MVMAQNNKTRNYSFKSKWSRLVVLVFLKWVILGWRNCRREVISIGAELPLNRCRVRVCKTQVSAEQEQINIPMCTLVILLCRRCQLPWSLAYHWKSCYQPETSEGLKSDGIIYSWKKIRMNKSNVHSSLRSIHMHTGNEFNSLKDKCISRLESSVITALNSVCIAKLIRAQC